MLETFAYLDAGTGSMLIQAFLGILFAASFIVRKYFAVIVAKTRGLITRQPVAEKDIA